MKYSDRKQKEERNQSMKRAIPAILLLIIIMIAGLLFFRYSDEKARKELAERATEAPEDYVEINGVKCRPKPNLETYLILGTDIRGDYADHVEYDGTGQADFIRLLIIDKTANTFATLAINRNTMIDFKVYYPDTGDYYTDVYDQICLAYAYAYDGKEKSCENMVDAVSRLLHGQKIDAYLSLGLNAIPIVNHTLGGVTVTIEDDFSNTCPSLKIGETRKLTDEEAEHFCHDRMNMANDDTNENRMKRQQAYLAAAKPILMEKCREKEDFILDFYDTLTPYMCTNITKKQISKIAKAALKNEDLGDFTIEGEEKLNTETGFREFYPDENDLADKVITLFYNRVD